MKKKYEDDDGRQVADMSDVHVTLFGSSYMPPDKRSRLKKKKKVEKKEPLPEYYQHDNFTKKETLSIIFKVMLMSLGIASVFIIAAALFILFCIYVWFK